IAFDEEGVIIEGGIEPRLAIAPAMQKFAIWTELLPNKLPCSFCSFDKSRIYQKIAGARNCANHEAIPGSENLIVQMRANTLGAGRNQLIRIRPKYLFY